MLGNPTIIPISNAPVSVNGILAAEDSIIPVLDLRVLLEKNNNNNSNKTCVAFVVVLFRGQHKCVGLIVDFFCKFYQINQKSISKLPAYTDLEFIQGVSLQDGEDTTLLMLALDRIINESSIISFLNIAWNCENYAGGINQNGF